MRWLAGWRHGLEVSCGMSETQALAQTRELLARIEKFKNATCHGSNRCIDFHKAALVNCW